MHLVLVDLKESAYRAIIVHPRRKSKNLRRQAINVLKDITVKTARSIPVVVYRVPTNQVKQNILVYLVPRDGIVKLIHQSRRLVPLINTVNKALSFLHSAQTGLSRYPVCRVLVIRVNVLHVSTGLIVNEVK